MKKLSIVLSNVFLTTVLLFACTKSSAQSPLDTVKTPRSNDPMIVNPGKGNDAMAVKPATPNDGMTVLSDTAFLAKNIRDNRSEIELAKLGRDKGKSAAVKRVADLILTDHTAILKDLASIATKRLGRVESDLSDMKMHSIISDDASFDQTWAGEMLAMHEAKIAELESFIGLTKNAELKAAVMKAIPKIKMHREMLLKIPRAKEKAKASPTI